MRLFIDVDNKHIGYKKQNYFTFKIESCYHPTNLWMLQTQGTESIKDDILKAFTYRKVQSIMYVTSVINGIEFHGKVASIAAGNCDGISDILISMGEENPNYQFSQCNYSFYEGIETYFIDIDELKTNKEFEELSIIECFAKLIDHDDIGYDIRFDRYLLNSERILNASEYLDLTDAE